MHENLNNYNTEKCICGSHNCMDIKGTHYEEQLENLRVRIDYSAAAR